MSNSDITELKYNVGFISVINNNNKEEYLFYFNNKKERALQFYTQIICDSIIEITEQMYDSVKYSDFISGKNDLEINVYLFCFINNK